MSKNQKFPGYIDHNDVLTTSMIYHGQNSHGKEEISSEILRLLKYKKVSDTQKIGYTIYPEYDQGDVSVLFLEELGQEVECLRQGQEENDILELVHYDLYLPLWYITFLYYESFIQDEKYKYGEIKNKDIDIEYFKLATKKELKNILFLEKQKEYVNHDVWALIGGHVFNIGG